MNITIYHNPACGTSRNVLALIRNSGEEPRVIEYLKTQPRRAELVGLIDRMGIPVRDVLRQKGTPYAELKLDNPALTDDQLIDAMMAHPILINRPIVVTPLGVKLCRPSETVLDILPNQQRGAFTKEDGERVIDAAGQRIAPAWFVTADAIAAPERPAGLVHVPGEAVAIEAIATCFLLIAVVGSGIMAERLSGGNVALALLANAIATGGALVALILAFGPRSGAHMNPVVTLAAAATGGMRWRMVPGYVLAQLVGAVLGVWLAHLMFDLPVMQLSAHVRTGAGQWVAEMVATFGLLATIWGCRAHPAPVTAFAVAAYITGAYWFTASTSFANPAVTIARALSDTFAGIRPADAPGFIVAQLAGMALALPLLRRSS